MRKLILIGIFVCLYLSLYAQEKRNLLTNSYSHSFVDEVLVKDYSWVNYPKYMDRDIWLSFSDTLRINYINRGEAFLNYNWPSVRATEYLAFTRTGDRMVMEKPQAERMKALQCLVMAELMEGKGRFMDDIVNGVFSFCEQSYWGLSACFYMYNDREKTNMPDIDNPIIDLWVGEVGCDLAWIWHLFHDEFDKITPVLSRRLKNELNKRILTPFYERNDYWWITGAGRGAVNNWTPWCSYNVLTCILLIEDDPQKRIESIYKTMTSVDLFFNIYPNDGGCDEGPTYWGLAGGKAFEYLSLLYKATNGRINIFDHNLIKEIGRYVYRAYIAGGSYYINFADSSPRGEGRAGVIYQYGRKINDPMMMQFGAFLLSKARFGIEPEITTLGPVFSNLFDLNKWENVPSIEPLIAEHYFPELQVAVVRDRKETTNGFFLAAKGGHNNEQHNHNDIGSCIIFFNGQPVLVDAGVGTYKKDTFNENRYNIWTMQSDYHNLPMINGFSQSPGKQYRAKKSKFKSTSSKVSFSTDISEAYPQEAQVEQWIRSYTLERGKKIIISDKYKLKEIKNTTELHYMTPMQCMITTPGLIEMKTSAMTIYMRYDSKILSAKIQQKEISDEKLQKVWGNELSMIVFEAKKELSGNFSIEIINRNK